MSYRKLLDDNLTVSEIHSRMKPEWVSPPSRPRLKSNPTTEEARSYVVEMEQYESSKAEYDVEREVYDKLDVEHHNNMVDLLWYIVGDVPEQYKDKVFSKAWSDGHSSGWSEILNELYGLVEIFR